MEGKLRSLKELVESSKKKTQNSSPEKYELLWDLTELIKKTNLNTLLGLQSQFLSIFVKDLIFQDPSPPLRRIIAKNVVCICTTTGAISQALNSLKSLLSIISLKTPLFTKIAAIECLGLIANGLGAMISSIANDCLSVLIKQFKSNSIDKKLSSIVALQRIVDGLNKSGVFVHGAILKSIKQLVTDKEPTVRTAISNLLHSIGNFYVPIHVELILQYAIKLAEDTAPSVRSAAASAIGNCLAVGYEHVSVVSKKNQMITNNPNNPNNKEIQKEWTIAASLEYLCVNFLKGKQELRAGITLSMITYLQQLQTHIIRKEMNIIIERILSLLVNQSMKFYHSLPELLQAHLCVTTMLDDGLRGHLGEEGQYKMADTLIHVLTIDGYNEYILILALRQLSYLLLDLGQGATQLCEKVEGPLEKLLSHQSYSVRGVCAITARSLAIALPDYHAKLLRSFLHVTNMEYAELATCKPDQVKLHLGPLQGNAYAVAGLISIIPHSQLGVPNTITKFALKTAKTLIKIDPTCKYAAMMVARTEAGWSIISSLMILGPTFVERKLVDLLDLWDNCFKIDNNAKPTTEKSVVVFCRLKACALEALCNFIRHNQPLLGQDIIERILLWLHNLLGIINKLPKLSNYQGSTIDIMNVLKSNFVKTHTALPITSYSTAQVPLITWLINELTKNSTTSLFKSLLRDEDSILGPWLIGKELKEAKLIQSPAVVVHDHSVVWSSDPEKELTNPIPSSKKFVDEIIELFAKLFTVQNADHQTTIILHLIKCIKEFPNELKNTLQTNIFCLLLKTLQTLVNKKKPFPNNKLLKVLFEFIESYLSTPETALRRAAGECLGYLATLQGEGFTENVVNSINQTLKVSKDSITRAGCVFSLGCIIRCLGGMKSTRYLPATISILHVLSKDPSPLTHLWALHSLWITIETTSLAFSAFANPTLYLVFSLLLLSGSTMHNVPGNSSTGSSLISSNAQSSNPSSSNLSNASNSSSGAGNGSLLYLSSITSHHTHQCIGKIVNACISSIGPELSPDSPNFRICLSIMSELQHHQHPIVQVESIYFKQMLALFAPQTVNAMEVLSFLRFHLKSKFAFIRHACIICLRQLIQIDHKSFLLPPSSSPSASTSNQNQSTPNHHNEFECISLQEQLFRMLDSEKDDELRSEIQLLITSMIEYLSIHKLNDFIELFRDIISASSNKLTPHTGGAPGKSNQSQDKQQQEGNGKNSNNDKDNDDSNESEEEGADASGQLTQSDNDMGNVQLFIPRWKTRIFSMECIGKLIKVIHDSSDNNQSTHFDLILANKAIGLHDDELELTDDKKYTKGDYLVFHLQDLVTVSFNCSTSTISGLRPVGVKVLKYIVEYFANADDPHYEGHKLLEIYSAQLAAALRPAFSKELSNPLLTAAASDVVVSFIKNTITADTIALKKVIKLLTDYVDLVGDLEYPAFSEKASTMVQLKILGSISILFNYSYSHLNKNQPPTQSQKTMATSSSILFELIQPFLEKLTKLWILVLSDWAILSTQNQSIQKIYKSSFYNFSSSSFVIEYYKEVWVDILLTTSTLLNSSLTHSTINPSVATSSSPPFTNEDFLLLFGLSIYLLSDSRDTSQIISILHASSYLLSSPYIVSSPFSFEEFIEYLNSLELHVQSSNAQIKENLFKVLLKIIKEIPIEFFNKNSNDKNEKLTEKIMNQIISMIYQPLISSNSSNADLILITDCIDCLLYIQRILPNHLQSSFSPTICHLLLKNIHQLPPSSLSNSLSTLSHYILQFHNTPSDPFLLNCISSFIQYLNQNPPTPSSTITLVSLLMFSSQIQYPLPSHLNQTILSLLHHWIIGNDVEIKEKLIKSLLNWYQSILSSSVPQNSLSIHYLQYTGSSVSYYLLSSTLSKREELILVDSIKLLLINHSLAPSSNKLQIMSVILPILIKLSVPSAPPSTVPSFSFQVLQTIAGSDPTDFKLIADNLPSNLRQVLQDTAQKQVQQSVTKQPTSRAKKPVKELSLDFSEYGEDE